MREYTHEEFEKMFELEKNYRFYQPSDRDKYGFLGIGCCMVDFIAKVDLSDTTKFKKILQIKFKNRNDTSYYDIYKALDPNDTYKMYKKRIYTIDNTLRKCIVEAIKIQNIKHPYGFYNYCWNAD